MTLSVGAWSSTPKARGPDGRGSRARRSSKLFVLDDVPLNSWVAYDPGSVYSRMSRFGHTRLSTAAISSLGPLLAGPLASDEAIRSLAAMGPWRLSSCSESSALGGSRILGMTKLAMRDSLLVCRLGSGDVLDTDVSLSVPTVRVGAGTTGDGEGIASSSSMGWSS